MNIEKTKENAIILFDEMIKQSWTYAKMTKEEQEKWLQVLYDTSRTENCLKGNFYQRWDILNAIYSAYLIGIGYTDFNWRN